MTQEREEIPTTFPCQERAFKIKFRRPDGSEQDATMAVCTKLKAATDGVCAAVLPVQFCEKCRGEKFNEKYHSISCLEAALRTPQNPNLVKASVLMKEKAGIEYIKHILLQMASSGLFEESDVMKCVKACGLDE